MFRLMSFIVCLFVYGAVFGQTDNPFRELDQTLDWDHFGLRSRSRFASPVFGDGALEKLDSESIRFFERSRFGSTVDIPEPSPLSAQDRRPRAAAVPPVNIPRQADVADPRSLPIRRPVGFFQRPGVLEPDGVFEEPATLREQRWFRELGGSAAATPESGAGRGAVAVGGEETRGETPLRTTNSPPNSEQTRRKFEEKLEGMLLSSPNVHLLSPVQVSYRDGVAVVRGVVPNQTHKVAVGNILLSDPAVRQVNNMISVIPLDPSRNPLPVDPK